MVQEKEEKNSLHHVCWTGGLDSTFRVIKLLLTTNKRVKPHYVIMHEESSGNEIDSMNNIRRAFKKKYPELFQNLLPTDYIDKFAIPRSEELDAQVKELKKKVKVHEQLHVLADYCNAFGIDQIDITYERDENLEPGELKVAQFFGVNPAFKSFRNPHSDLTKKGCFTEAKKEGWDDLLKLTSFCRRPRRKGRPCGTCGPCCDAVKEGMGFRLPFASRMRARILIPFRLFYRKNYLIQDTNWFFRLIKRWLEPRL